ncbi:MAG: hypothetical protein C3F12_04450 [Candidatus Methylomirabilota bacterium]|nr:hypothetical protein [Candidatus Methylomirabilis sp.]NJD67796.1 hypothetical protein [candidate division NC10 bacterium]PWB47232.1 MAG: hypothetical protein C3F12_04450 [candidate division NC10 bacterium]
MNDHAAQPVRRTYALVRSHVWIHYRQRRKLAFLVALALWLLCLPAVQSIAEGATHGDIVRDRFQQLLDQWGYHEWWSMWEQGTSQSRATISKDALAQRMERSMWKLACCDKRLRALQIAPVSPGHVVVSATLLFETKGSPRSVQERPYPINLNFYLEEEQWRVDLSGLSQP